MIKFLKGMAIIGVISFLFAPSAMAFSYSDSRPLAFTYHNKANYWFGCGPLQCTYAGEKSEDAAFDYLVTSRNGRFRFIERWGRCNVYEGNGRVDSGDYKASRVVKMLYKRCD